MVTKDKIRVIYSAADYTFKQVIDEEEGKNNYHLFQIITQQGKSEIIMWFKTDEIDQL